jgi:hypothetical protein
MVSRSLRMPARRLRGIYVSPRHDFDFGMADQFYKLAFALDRGLFHDPKTWCRAQSYQIEWK